MARVDYTVENVDKCQCGSCPVYKSSPCAVAKNGTITWTPGVLPPADIIEGIYCASAVGKSDCSDQDGNKACNCPTCAVWEDNSLNSTYFCLKGSAEQIENG